MTLNELISELSKIKNENSCGDCEVFICDNTFSSIDYVEFDGEFVFIDSKRKYKSSLLIFKK